MEPDSGIPSGRGDSFTDRFLTDRFTERQLNQWTIVFAALTVLSCLCSLVTFFNPQVASLGDMAPSGSPRAAPSRSAREIGVISVS